MKCDKCNQEIKETEEREFNGLIVRPIEQFDVAYKDIVVPNGWRIPTLNSERGL